MSVQLVFFDIDETLCRMGVLAQNNYRALRALYAGGMRLAIATGRSVCMLPKDIRRLFDAGMIDALVSANGQINMVGEEVISHYPLPQEDVVQLIAIAREHGLDYQQASQHHIAWSRHLPHRDEVTGAFPAFRVDPDYYVRHTIYQLSVFLPETLEDNALRQAFAGLGYHFARWHRGGADVVPQDGSKARGIRDVCQALGIDVARTMAFGDGLNDIEMLAHVGIGVAMGDARERLKAVADYVTGTIEEDGIRQALAHFGLLDRARTRRDEH